jgi:HEAT repeat protein
MMDHLAEFQTLLEKLLSPDNDTRQAAEDAYEKITKEQRASFLFMTAKNQQFNFEHRQLGLVLLRRLLSNDWQELWPSWSAETQATFCNEVLLSTQNESNEALRKRYCDLIAEMARNTLDEESNQTWQDVLKFLFSCASSNEARLKEVALLIVDNVPGIFGRQQNDYVNLINEMFSATLQFTDSSDEKATAVVRYQAVKAASSFICDNEEDPNTIRILQPLIPHILRVCAYSIEQEEDDSCLQRLTDIASTVPKMLRNHLPELCSMCIKTLSNAEADTNFRHAALEVMVSLAESNPAMVRKQCASFIPQILNQCLILMFDLEDNPEWYEADDENEDDDDDNATVGETSLDRLATALGGKTVLQPCLNLIAPIMQSEDWKFRHAGLMALSTIGEGCHKQMEAMLEQIIDSILPFLRDPHPRVRYAACNALGQMSSDFAPKLQKNLHQKVIPALLATLEDLANPRVAAHAGAALVNFSEDAPKSVMGLYLDPIMMKLLWVLEQTFNQLVEKGKKLVLEQIVTTIASVADSSETRFADYYDRVMPCLKYILQHAVQPELRLLRGKTIECASLIGVAVGKEKFITDANEIMQLLLKTQLEFGEQDGDDPQVSYMMSAWARVCTILGQDFVQYLPTVMPAVMKVASFKPEVTIVECEDADHLQGEEDWQFVNLGDQQSFGIKTAGLEDKAAACQMLVTYARELKGGFGEYVEQTTQLMVPLLKFYFHDGVRTAAAESLPELLEAAKVKGPEFVAGMWRFILKDLLKAIENEPENDVLSELLWCLAKCVECLGAGCLTNEDLKEIVDVLEHQMNKHFEKAAERDELRKDEDYDEEVEKELVDEHDEDTWLLSKVSDVLHAAFGTHKEMVVPYFEKLLPHLIKLLEPNRPYPDYQWALCIFDDLIEFGGLASLKYQRIFLTPMVNALGHQMPEVRQAAAYGFGIMGMFGGNGYAQACAEAIPFLAKMIGAPDARSDESNMAATENAIAAVGKILKFNNSMVDVGAVVPTFISWLPVWEDKEECPHVYGYLCDLIESNNPVAMGDNGANVPHLIAIVVDAFRLSALEEETEKNACSGRMRTILKHVQANESMFQACLAVLNDEQKMTLQKELAVQ